MTDADEPFRPDADEQRCYREIDGHQLHLNIFRPKQTDGAPVPAIVFFFGGGWQHGTVRQFHPHARLLADHGMFAACAEYRIKSEHGTPPSACVEDGKAAVRYLRTHSAELGIDPQRIAAGGGSAGGHVALCTGLVDTYDPDPDAVISCRPQVMIGFNPVLAISGAHFEERFGDTALALSPMHQLRADMPPSLVFLGTEDRLIPVAEAEGFRDGARSLGAECTLHLYDGAGHGYFNYKGPRSDDPQTWPYYETTEQMLAFLTELGWLAS